MRSVILAAAVLLSLLAQPARAEPARASFVYAVYFGGLDLAEIKVAAKLSDSTYRMTSSTRAVGLLGSLYPFTAEVEASGSVINGAVAPSRYVSRTNIRDKVRTVEIRRAATGPAVVSVTPPIEPDERDEVPVQMRDEALDPVSVIASLAIGWHDGNTCTGTARVFNGKTRTDIHYRPVGRDNLAPNEYSVFTGPALRCEVRWEVLAGGYKKKWLGSDREFPPVSLWVARQDGVSYWVPVRLEAETMIAPVLVHLTGYQAGSIVRMVGAQP
jgi:hypothetical protein